MPGQPEARRSGLRSGKIGAVLAALVLTVVVVAVLVGPLVAPDPTATSLGSGMLRPGSPGHTLGTDRLGRDLLARTLQGGRNSLEVGVAAIVLGLIAGAAVGTISGLRGGWLDAVVLIGTQAMLAIPGLVLALAVVGFTGGNRGSLVLGLVLLTTPAYVRLARAGAMSLRNRGFIEAARAAGGTDRHIAFAHILPNVLPGLLTFALLALASVIGIEASLSFLGLGIRPPAPSWGAMISEGVAELREAPYLVLVPGSLLVATIASLNVLGETIRRRLAAGSPVLPRVELVGAVDFLLPIKRSRAKPQDAVGIGRDPGDVAILETVEDE